MITSAWELCRYSVTTAPIRLGGPDWADVVNGTAAAARNCLLVVMMRYMSNRRPSGPQPFVQKCEAFGVW